ncbi:MAG: zf-HC2 domain-containing protein [Planctomycetota bacterium]|nr:MAG: zf-HC2 domain-containing protein [Planctomycetota bacterium]
MNCRTARKWMPLHCGGDLPLAKARALEEHVASCQTCHGELQTFRDSRGALLELRDEADLNASGIWRTLEPRLDALEARQARILPWYRQPRRLAQAAAVLVLVAAAPLMWPGLPSGGEDGSTSGNGGLAELAGGNGAGATPVMPAVHGALPAQSPDPGGLTPVPRDAQERMILRMANQHNGVLPLGQQGPTTRLVGNGGDVEY